jgi:hypothetical protein
MVTYRPKRQKAKEDIKVFKILDKNSHSLVYEFKYEIGKTYDLGKKLEVSHIIKSRFWDINEGFHSFDEFTNFGRRYCGDYGTVKEGFTFGFYGLCDIVALCTIPKGASYYYDEDGGLYVSDSIRCDEMMSLGDFLEKNPDRLIY